MTVLTTKTDYPEIGVFVLASCEVFENTDHGATDLGAEVFSLDTGEKIDTGSVLVATWVMDRRIAADNAAIKARALASAVAELNKAVARGDKEKHIAKYRANVAHLSRA